MEEMRILHLLLYLSLPLSLSLSLALCLSLSLLLFLFVYYEGPQRFGEFPVCWFNKQLTSGSAEVRRGAALLTSSEREREVGRGRKGERERPPCWFWFELSRYTLGSMECSWFMQTCETLRPSSPPSHSFSPQQGPKETPGKQTTSSRCTLLGDLDSHR